MALGATAAAPATAAAGAWTLPEGTGQVIVGLEGKVATERYGDGGSRRQTPEFQKAELSTYFEYGLLDRLTLLVAPRFERVSVAPPTDELSTGFGHTELGARVLVARFDPPTAGWWQGSVVSMQASALVPGSVATSDPLLGNEAFAEYDARLMTGTAFAFGGWTGFVDAQAGVRVRDGPAPDEARVDLTLGLRPRSDWLIMAKAFLVETIQPGTRKYPDGGYARLQLGVVKDLTPRWSLELATNSVVAGRNALAETGVLAAVWHRF